MSRLLRVRRLHPDDQRGRREHAQPARDHEGSRRRRQVHVGELVASLVDGQLVDVEDVRALHYHAPRRTPEVDGVDNQQEISTGHQLLHQMDAADSYLEQPDTVGQRLGEQGLGHRRTDPVVCSQHVAEARDDRFHGGRIGGVAESERDVLLARLDRYPVDRYPVQYATTQFHLGSMLLQSGETGPSIAALTTACEAFARSAMTLERAKATVMLGVALRAAGRLPEAADAFSAACAELAALDQPAEQAAALYNLGLVLSEAGRLSAAHAAWGRARELFLAAGHPGRAAAAARDHGASLLTTGDVDAALPRLQEAMTLAERAGDEPGVGAAANAVGLAYLAVRESLAAVAALRRAVGAFPRSVRPAEHAMAKANLALAHEQAGDRERARLAAGQALAVPSAAPPVRAQAQLLLTRLPGWAHEDLLAVLDREDREHWLPVLRDEVLRWPELSGDERQAMVSGFLRGVVARAGKSYDMAQSFLAVVLEQPPRTYELLISAVSRACSEPGSDRLRAVLASAMARFAIPQWQRLAASLNAVAAASGDPATWT